MSEPVINYCFTCCVELKENESLFICDNCFNEPPKATPNPVVKKKPIKKQGENKFCCYSLK